MPGKKKPLSYFMRFANRTIMARAEEFMRDPDLISLTKDIALARAILEHWRYSGENPDLLVASQLLRTIGELVERHHRICVQRQYYLRVDQVSEFLRRIVDILEENLEVEKASFLARLIEAQARISLEKPDGDRECYQPQARG